MIIVLKAVARSADTNAGGNLAPLTITVIKTVCLREDLLAHNGNSVSRDKKAHAVLLCAAHSPRLVLPKANMEPKRGVCRGFLGTCRCRVNICRIYHGTPRLPYEDY